MVTLELQSVAGGWKQARFGPTDQVDYALYESDAHPEAEPVLRSYDSVHTFLRLYDLARLERTEHPAFLGATLREAGTVGPDEERLLELAVHGTSVRTTYPELRAALLSFFEVLFPALDAETPGETPDLSTFEVGVTELDRLYAQVAGEQSGD